MCGRRVDGFVFYIKSRSRSTVAALVILRHCFTWLCHLLRKMIHTEYVKISCSFVFCLTVHHHLGKVIQMNQLDATMIY